MLEICSGQHSDIVRPCGILSSTKDFGSDICRAVCTRGLIACTRTRAHMHAAVTHAHARTHGNVAKSFVLNKYLAFYCYVRSACLRVK